MEVDCGKNKNYVTMSVETLVNRSLWKILDFLPNYLPSLEILPPNVKDRLIHLMSMRGLITDDNITLLLHKKVKVLDLSDCDISDEGLIKVATVCSQLQKIDLNSITKNSRTSVTSVGVTAIARACRHLQVVYLRRCASVTDDGIISLSQNCPQLRYINIGGCTQITDSVLVEFGQNQRFLRSLNISKSNVTDDGIISMVNGPCGQSLKELHLDSCKHITDESVEAVLQFCPNIQILLFHGCPHITEQSREALEESLGGKMKMKQITWTIY